MSGNTMVGAQPADEWLEGRVTGNSALLTGYVMGLIMGRRDDDLYAVVDVKTEAGEIVVECFNTGTRFAVTVRQIGGEE